MCSTDVDSECDTGRGKVIAKADMYCVKMILHFDKHMTQEDVRVRVSVCQCVCVFVGFCVSVCQ